MSSEANRIYWNEIATLYQSETSISIDDYHYGPLLAGDKQFSLLPNNLNGLRSLELACGAAQNSLFLASKGADCIAGDISQEQLNHAQELAKSSGRSINTQIIDMNNMDVASLGTFDLIHSSFGVPFADNPEQLFLLWLPQVWPFFQPANRGPFRRVRAGLHVRCESLSQNTNNIS